MGKPIMGPGPRALDLVLVLDTTGSMQPWLRELRRQWPSVLRGLNGIVGLRLGVVAFQDHHPGAAYVTREHSPSFILSEASRFLEVGLEVGGGCGGAEALECGLRATRELPWRPEARKLAIVIGDRPPHGGGLDRVDACPDGVDWRDEVEALAAAGIAVCALRVGTCLAAQRSFEYLAARTGGVFLDQPHIRALPPALIGLARRVAGAGLGLTGSRRRAAVAVA